VSARREAEDLLAHAERVVQLLDDLSEQARDAVAGLRTVLSDLPGPAPVTLVTPPPAAPPTPEAPAAPATAERRSGLDRRTGGERRRPEDHPLAARILVSTDSERRSGGERRSGFERRSDLAHTVIGTLEPERKARLGLRRRHR
jgi:hypothetical protein